MKKDIFIDAQIANKFAKPPTKHFVDLITWLLEYDPKDLDNNAVIVFSDKLYNEYVGGCKMSLKEITIATIIDKMIKQNRYTKIKKTEIKSFQQKYFKTSVWKGLRCKKPGSHDTDHMPLVFLSVRKMALTEDENFLYDLVNFPKFGKDVKVARSPELLNYK